MSRSRQRDDAESEYPTFRLFTGNANRPLAEAVARHLDQSLGDITVSRFNDGEVNVRINESVRGLDCFIIQPTCRPVNENLMELLVMIDAFSRASAARVIPIIPYYGYARQDKKAKPREPITARLVADMIINAGASRLFAIDLHAGQLQGFFDVPVDHLPAAPILARYFLDKGWDRDELVVVSPDVGGVERATVFAETMSASLAIIAKRRPAPGKVEVTTVIGDVQDRIAIMVDDMIDTGGSITAGAQMLMEYGAREVYACCTHGVFSGNALQTLEESVLKEIVITDTIPLPQPYPPKITVRSVAHLIAHTIDSIHEEASVSTLYDKYERLAED